MYIILCNRAEEQSDLYPSDGEGYLADKEVAKELKRIYPECKILFFEDVDLDSLYADLVFNFADYFSDARKEAEIPSKLKRRSIPYTGNDEETILICGDKLRLYNLLKKNNVPVPEVIADVNQIRFPVIAKKRFAHGSNGLSKNSIISSARQIASLQFNDEYVIQQFLEGREFFVSLIGNEKPTALPILQVDFGEDSNKDILCYKAKWANRSNAYKKNDTRLAEIDEVKRRELEEIGKRVFAVLGCRGYVSIDVREDSAGNPLVIDVNPNPYIAPDADIVKAASLAGISYPDLLKKIAELGLGRAETMKIKMQSLVGHK